MTTMAKPFFGSSLSLSVPAGRGPIIWEVPRNRAMQGIREQILQENERLKI